MTQVTTPTGSTQWNINIKLLLASLYFILVIGIEPLYRNKLFDYSVEWEKNWQKDSNNSYLGFFKVITEFGSQGVFLPLIVVFFLWFPINKAYTFLTVCILSVYIDNVFKMIYGNPRPFWVDPTISLACDGGFGNPSGHSFSSSAVYLTVWHMITQFKILRRTLIKIGLLILFLALAAAIVLSRLYLGVHGINQILYGSLLGTGTYYVIMNVLDIHDKTGKQFFDFIKSKTTIAVYLLIHITFLVLAFALYGLTDNNPAQWVDNLKLACPDLKLFRTFNYDGLFGCLTIFALIGAHWAITLLAYKTSSEYPDKEEPINKWNVGGLRQNLFKLLLTAIFAIPLIMNLVVPSEADIIIVYIFKIALPYVLTVIGFYFGCIYTCIRTRIANKEIYDDASTPSSYRIDNVKEKV
jgi:membrane-associated phospholipid phosphatase